MNEKLYCVVILGGEDGEPDSEQYRSEPMPIGMATKVSRGREINLDHDKYYVDIVEAV
jgi:hypothetical protein